VRFRPTAQDGRSATIAAVGTDGSTTVGQLTGRGVRRSIVITPNPFTFAGTLVGTTSESQALTVRNVGNADVTLGARSVAGTNPVDFTVVEPAAAASCAGRTLAPAATCTLSIHQLRPTSGGDKSALVTVATTTAGLSATATLRGLGIASVVSIALDPAQLNFGDIVVGQISAAQSAVLRNTGTGPVTITAVGTPTLGDFTASDPGADRCVARTLAPGGTCTVASFTMQPSSVGLRQATVSVSTSTPGVTGVVSLLGAGLPPVTPTPPTPVVELGRQVIATGEVVSVKGSGFAANEPVLLRWSIGIPLDRGLLADADGKFTTSVLIMPHDFLGPRQIEVLFGGPEPVVDDLLVLPPHAQPPNFVVG
jgi:hypothetical protein